MVKLVSKLQTNFMQQVSLTRRTDENLQMNIEFVRRRILSVHFFSFSYSFQEKKLQR